jgi:hypothetical protein
VIWRPEQVAVPANAVSHRTSAVAMVYATARRIILSLAETIAFRLALFAVGPGTLIIGNVVQRGLVVVMSIRA